MSPWVSWAVPGETTDHSSYNLLEEACTTRPILQSDQTQYSVSHIFMKISRNLFFFSLPTDLCLLYSTKISLPNSYWWIFSTCKFFHLSNNSTIHTDIWALSHSFPTPRWPKEFSFLPLQYSLTHMLLLALLGLPCSMCTKHVSSNFTSKLCPLMP